MSRQLTRRRPRRAGFTLMELLLVLVILVVLGSMTAAYFMGTRDKALVDAARGEVGIITKQIDLYQFHMRSFPSRLEDLVDRPSGDGAEDWGGPYLKELKNDPWRNPFRLVVPGKKNTNSYDVYSVGPDGQDGTDDDIGNWTK